MKRYWRQFWVVVRPERASFPINKESGIFLLFWFFVTLVYWLSDKFFWSSVWPFSLILSVGFLLSWWLYLRLEEAVFIAFILGEMLWVLSFSALNYLTMGGVLTVFFFGLWDFKIITQKNHSCD